MEAAKREAGIATSTKPAGGLGVRGAASDVAKRLIRMVGADHAKSDCSSGTRADEMNHPRRFGKSQRMAIYLNSDGKCQLCQAPITLSDFHVDHIVPWSKGGPTTLSNAQALCSSCNLSKSSTMTVPYQNHLPPGFILRDWQEEFVNRFYASALQQIGKPPAEIQAFILHAFPGCGKSLAQTLVARVLIEQNIIDQVIICVPSKILRGQMKNDARRIGLFLNMKRLEVLQRVSTG